MYSYPCVCRGGDVCRLPFPLGLQTPSHESAACASCSGDTLPAGMIFYVLNTSHDKVRLCGLWRNWKRRAQIYQTVHLQSLSCKVCKWMNAFKRRLHPKNTNHQETEFGQISTNYHDPFGLGRGSMKNSEVRRWSEDSASSQQALEGQTHTWGWDVSG